MNRLVLIATIAACGGQPKPAPVANSTAPVDVSCAGRTADLKAFLATAYDLHAVKPAAPWPTGDAETDKAIEAVRERYHRLMVPRDPAAPAPRLEAGVKPGALDIELAKCQPAIDRLSGVGTADDDAQKQAAFAGVADGIAQCDCKVNVPFVRALMYMTARGPD